MKSQISKLKSTLALAVILGAVPFMAVNCDSFNRALAALDTAPLLIDSFGSGSPEEKAKLKEYFADAATALRAYKASKTDGNWQAFIAALQNIAKAHVSDPKGAARISAIVALVRVIFGIPNASGTDTQAISDLPPPPPNIDIKGADLKRLEELMRPIR